MVREYSKVDYRSARLFKDVAPEDWYDWKWQLKNTILDIDSLRQVVELSAKEVEQLQQCLTKFKMAITPYYAALMDKEDRNGPVRLQAVPLIKELYDDVSDLDDPLSEDADSEVPGLTHRYPDRALLLVTNRCSMYCRHCTRRRVVGHTDTRFSKENFDRATDYIRNTPEIRDVIVSGGDPLVMSDEKIEYVLARLSEIDHVEMIRIGTRMPVVMPMRITDKLVNIIKKYHPVWVNTHFNHPREVTFEAREACLKMVDGGIPMGNQAVLLRGINDDPAIMKHLVHEMMLIRVRPYYIYQCDLSRGISHFRTPVSKGIEIIENLRGHTTGLAVPTFVVDAPGGGGKIPVMPTYLIGQSDKRVILRNYEGVIATYAEPSHYSDSKLVEDPKYKPKDGVAGLLNGEGLTLEPEGLERGHRKEKRIKKAAG